MTKFVPRQRKHKVLARQKAQTSRTDSPSVDSNQEVLLPVQQSDKEIQRKELKKELLSQNSNVSSKKQKRLDKYIENKLRKDETVEYLRKLEKEKEKFDVRNSAQLLSSKELNKGGKGKKRGWNEYVNGQVDTDRSSVDIPITVKDNPVSNVDSHLQNDEDGLESEDSFEADNQDAFNDAHVYQPNDDLEWLAKKAPAPSGTGLAKPLEIGADGLPIIPLRLKRKARPEQEQHNRNADLGSDIEELQIDSLPWEGFNSESGRSDDESQSGTSHSLSEEDDLSDDGSEDVEETRDDSDASEESEADSTFGEAERSTQLKIHTRTSAFKTWAREQLNQAVGHTPAYSVNGEGELQPPSEKSSLPKISSVPSNTSVQLVNGLPALEDFNSNRVVRSVYVERSDQIQETRSLLPILQREQEIMEAIHHHSVVVIKGDTGSGKTTQLPQFLYEAGYGDPKGPTPGMIGITQPRRVAAVSMAKRVGEELSSHGDKVSHQVRFDSTVSSKTAIKFMTDGILLRELSQDLLLKKYSVLIIDEAHERSVNTDILIGMLSRIVPARLRKDKFNPDPKPLKLIIMSATLNIEDFLHDKLFTSNLRPPIVEIEGRQHRVTTHFTKRSRGDYLEEVVEKVKKAHNKLPRGGMLVFLTGQNEIRQVQSRLRTDLARSSGKLEINDKHPSMHLAASELPLEIDDLDFGVDAEAKHDVDDEDHDITILTQSDEDEEAGEFEISDDENEDNDGGAQNIVDGIGHNLSARNKDVYDKVHILPLYSQLSTKEQLRVFEPPPERSRLIVLATNVAETSLTIPGIRYVFDCGRSKERKYNLDTGVQSFDIDYISKASAQQRAGRAGRTGPGHCWRLYSSAVYERFFPDHSEPEILRSPGGNVVLQIKSFAYPRPVADFPFPTAPSRDTLSKAEQLLRYLRALDEHGTVTDIGKQLAIFPLPPRLGAIMAVGISADMLPAIIAIVAGLAVSELFINQPVDADYEDEQSEDEQNERKQAFGRARAILSHTDQSSDVMKLLTAVRMYIEASDSESFCKQYFLRPKAMSEVKLLVQQLQAIVLANHSSVKVAPIDDTKRLSPHRTTELNRVIATGYVDQVAIRWDCAPNPPALTHKPRRAIDVPYLPLIPLSRSASAELHERAIFIHPSSLLCRLPPKELPQYIVYTHLQQSQARIINTNSAVKTRMFPLTPVDGITLRRVASKTGLVQYGKPVPKTKIEELAGSPKTRICWVSAELRAGSSGGPGWPLPPTKVEQVLDVKSASGWRIKHVIGW